MAEAIRHMSVTACAAALPAMPVRDGRTEGTAHAGR